MILILGRFQPLHNGHLKVIKDAYSEDKDMFIAIGSSQKKDERDNPFSGEERREMVRKTLEANCIPAKIGLVPDIPCDRTYVEHVLKHIAGRPDRILTENQWTFDLFSSAGFEVKMTPRYFGISSTDIRKRIAEGREWEELVPEQVAAIIKEIGGVERIRKVLSS